MKGECYSHIIPSLLLVGGRFRTWSDRFHMWAVGFMRGRPFSYQAVVGRASSYLDGHLLTWAVGGRPHCRCLGRPCGGDWLCAGGIVTTSPWVTWPLHSV